MFNDSFSDRGVFLDRAIAIMGAAIALAYLASML